MIEITCSEQDLEDFLCKDNNLQKHLGLRFLKRQVKTPVGIIDIIAYNNNTKRFVLIELKKDLLDYKAFFQIERYALYLKKLEYSRWEHKDVCRGSFLQEVTLYNKPSKERTLDCLLIGKNISPDLYSSVEHWESDSNLCHARMWYTLFGYNFEQPISFRYFQPAQIEIEQETYEGE